MSAKFDQSQFDSKISEVTKIDRPITASLFVSPDGDGTDGLTWATAYATINAALDAASTDVNDLTAILLAPHATYYDIDKTGDPTWAANVEIIGPHRRWSVIKNTNATATSILKLTGKASITNCSFSQQGAVNGLILTNNAFRVRKCGFNSSACTSAVNGIYADGTLGTLVGGLIEDVRVVGNIAYTTGLNLNNVTYSDFAILDAHGCLIGCDITHASTVNNFFTNIDFGGNSTGLKLQTGVMSMHFYGINFHENTVNVDDSSMDHHHWNDINAELDIQLYPEDRAGIEITAGDTIWGSDTEIRSAALATKPFKIVGYSLDPSNEETTLIRISADSETSFFITDVFAAKKGKATGSGPGTDFIFNTGTRISASCLSPDTGRTVNVWLQIQEI